MNDTEGLEGWVGKRVVVPLWRDSVLRGEWTVTTYTADGRLVLEAGDCKIVAPGQVRPA